MLKRLQMMKMTGQEKREAVWTSVDRQAPQWASSWVKKGQRMVSLIGEEMFQSREG